jgi:hypothetical protein
VGRTRLAASVLPLVLLISACCFMGTPPPGTGTGRGTGTALPPPAPTPGHTCHLVADLHFASTKPSGEPWDAAGGSPDPFIVVRQDGVEVGRTDRVQDTRDAHFVLDVSCAHDRPLDIEVLDRDLSFDDHAGDFVAGPNDDYATPSGVSVYGDIVVTRS